MDMLWKFWWWVGLHFLQILSVWQNLFDFKPDTLIINHQLELNGTRVKHLDHAKRAYKHEVLIIAHSGVSRETRCLKVVRSLLQLAYFVYARSESPDEVMRTCRLVGAFATCGCNKNHHLVCWPIYSINFYCGPLFYFLIQYYNWNS